MPFLKLQPLTAEAFEPYGDIIAPYGAADVIINEGRCDRYSDLGRLDFADGKAGISVFQSELVTLPYTFEMMERHPLGSQAFLPASAARSIVIVAKDNAGEPDSPLAFLSQAGQGYNLLRNVWHGVLAPLEAGLFFVIDRIGEGDNLETQTLREPLTVVPQ